MNFSSNCFQNKLYQQGHLQSINLNKNISTDVHALTVTSSPCALCVLDVHVVGWRWAHPCGGQGMISGVFCLFSPHFLKLGPHWTWNSSIELDYLGSQTLKSSCLRLPVLGSHLSTIHRCYTWVLRIWTQVHMFTQQVLYLAIEPSARRHTIPSVSRSLLRLLERLRELNLTTSVRAKHNLMELCWF